MVRGWYVMRYCLVWSFLVAQSLVEEFIPTLKVWDRVLGSRGQSGVDFRAQELRARSSIYNFGF